MQKLVRQTPLALDPPMVGTEPWLLPQEKYLTQKEAFKSMECLDHAYFWLNTSPLPLPFPN